MVDGGARLTQDAIQTSRVAGHIVGRLEHDVQNDRRNHCQLYEQVGSQRFPPVEHRDVTNDVQPYGFLSGGGEGCSMLQYIYVPGA